MANRIKFTGTLKLELDLSHLKEIGDNLIEIVCQYTKMKYLGKRVCIKHSKNTRSCFEVVRFHATFFVLESYEEVDKKYIFVFKSLPEDTNIGNDYEPLKNYKYCLEYNNGEKIEKWYYKAIEAAEAIAVARAYGEKATICEI